MRQTLSVLQSVTKQDLILDPFPYLVVKNALPIDLCHELLETYPSPSSQGVDESLDNIRWSTHAENIDEIPNLAPIWREFVRYHVSQAFFNEVMDLFSEPLQRLYPNYLNLQQSIFHQPVTVRNVHNLAAGRFSLDAQISGNTPAVTSGVPRGIHTDAPNALYGGLYYLRDHNDDSLGGDLQVWKWKEGYSRGKKAGEYREDVDKRHVELVETIQYKTNTLVFFLNSIDSLHSVTLRFPTPHTRKFLNLLADSDRNLFEFKPSPHLRLRNLVRRSVVNRLFR